MTGNVVLDIAGLSAEFATREGTAHVVRDVGFTVRAGEKVAIVGESGSGKSTFALALLGLLDPPGRIAAGAVRLDGRDLVGLGEGALKRVRGRSISLVFQDPMGALDPIKTIGAQLVDTLRRHQPGLSRADARRRAAELLREVEVGDAERRLDDYPHQYSGGMRQRVMIAIAIANDPDIVVADEPTTALDVTTQAQILALFDRLVARRGLALLMITHNLAVVANFCDTLQVMYAGRIVERGAVDAVFERPAHPYTEALIESIPDPARRGARLRTIEGLPPDLRRLPTGCSFEPRCPVGRGRPVCRTVAPPPVPLADRGPGAFAECHFAAERAGEGAA
ncbi:ABC transporter ATP-binding protein [Prosthecomicrobium pneumaticum]|uniref:Oligopeptide/dipeptide ABC transporter ATP-binding protein n=1 Tax=Prosthecomicrobium pneumaticum TaxID=81895 RepID=A0A7W9FKV0_9HYPH|nr:ABC transporter ATP-binding protein [Prosthecomicrobium pneumaticum]MBB5751618.1 oligopeptide/dipeptide ABC transporter ATP-binding protein [Prosthecomicrobium pneumaticum]